MIDMYYIIVSGYVLKYAITYLLGGHFGSDKAAYYMNFIFDPIEPLIYAGTLMIIIVLLLSKGITELVEKVTKIIMPLLFVLLLICGFWALFAFDGAIDGLKFYLIPDFSKFTWKTFADACMQVMFSVGIGWAIFVTLGASVKDSANIRKDSMMVTVCDTAVALTAFYCYKVWGFKGYEKELTKDGRDGKLSMYDKIVMTVAVPILTLIVILNCFGFIK